MRVSFFYYEECPSHEQALERLREVMAEESISTDVEVFEVETEDQARPRERRKERGLRIREQRAAVSGEAVRPWKLAR